MDAKQTKIVIGTVLLSAALWLVIPILGYREPPIKPAESLHLMFDPLQAFEYTREFVTQHPRRVLGSIEARQSTGYLQQHFLQFGCQVSYAHFDAVIAGRKQVGRNVYALLPGSSGEILVVMAHYDTARTTVQGAMDDGSGIGILLELARVFAREPLGRSLLLVASDGEEWGMLGALELARDYPGRDRIRMGLSLDYVAAGDVAFLRFDSVGQMGGYAPPWLRLLARAAGEADGAEVYEPAGVREFVERAFLLSGTDQGPLLNAGIPAINLGSRSTRSAFEYSIYHSSEDSPPNLKLAGFEKCGRTAERIIRTAGSLESFPHEPMGSFRVHGNTFLPPAAMSVLQWLAFLPLLTALCFHVVNHGRYFSLARIQREVSAFLGTLFPFLLIYTSVMLLMILRRLPVFSLYPPAPKDPVLDHPQYGVILGILTTVMMASVGCYFLVRFLNRRSPRPDYFVSKSILLVILCATSIGALLYNPYWAVCFLLLPAWVWALAGPGRGPGGRAANRLMILAGGVPYFAISGSYAAQLGLGWGLIWYEILALGTGMFKGQAFFLSAAAFTLGIRFLAIQSSSRGD